IKYLPRVNSHLLPGQKIMLNTAGFRNVVANKRQILALCFTGVIMFGHFLVIPFINPYLEFNLGYSKTITPLVYLVGGIAAFISSNLLGRLSDRIGKLKVFRFCLFFSLPLVLVLTHLSAWPYWLVLLLFAIWFTLS